MVGIYSYGVYIPRYRIKVPEIARVWGGNANDVMRGLGVFEKSVPPDLDEDTATIAVEAARAALRRRTVDTDAVGAIYVGERVAPPLRGQAHGLYGRRGDRATPPNMTAADYEFACKAGTAGIQTCMGMVKSGMIPLGIAIGADVAQALPVMRSSTRRRPAGLRSSSAMRTSSPRSTTPVRSPPTRPTSGGAKGRTTPPVTAGGSPAIPATSSTFRVRRG